MQCRWHDKQIVVLDSVVITDPYTLADVKGSDPNAVKRVKKVVRSLVPVFIFAVAVTAFLLCCPILALSPCRSVLGQ